MKRRLASAAAAVVLIVAGATGCGGPDITQTRVENAVAPTFAHLYAYQSVLLGRSDPGADSQASATCTRNSKGVKNQGAGNDWVCQLLLQRGSSVDTFTYELTVQANGCYTADGPPALVGGHTIAVPGGRIVINPLVSFDGCFDTGSGL
jgi:ABC-2 type transport system permease protein